MEISSSKTENEKNTIRVRSLGSQAESHEERNGKKWVFSFSSIIRTKFNRLHGNCVSLCFFLFHQTTLHISCTSDWSLESRAAHGAAVQFNIKLAHVLLFARLLHFISLIILLCCAIHSIAGSALTYLQRLHGRVEVNRRTLLASMLELYKLRTVRFIDQGELKT